MIHPFLLAGFPILRLFAQNGAEVPYRELLVPLALAFGVSLAVWLVATALIHHLAIAGNVPLPSIADLFQQLAPWLIVEFVPPEDPQVLRLVAQHRHIHHPYDRLTFERAFQCQYSIEAAAPIPESGRMLYLMRRLGDRSSNAR